MKQKFILFFSTSIPYGIIMGLFYSDDVYSNLNNGVISGIIFGLLMTTILSVIQRIKLKKLGQKKGNVKIINTAEIVIEGSKQDILVICENSLSNIIKCKIEEINIREGILKAKAGMTWYTWGDLILFKLDHIHENKYKVLITSRPIVKTTVIDYGKNQDNINRIIKFFREIKRDVIVIQDGCNST